MSTWCGNCRNELLFGTHALYCLERDDSGAIRLPDESKDYLPAHCFLCPICWRYQLPQEEKKYEGATGKEVVERSSAQVFLYSPCDSSIAKGASQPFYLHATTVERYFPKALEVINRDAKERVLTQRMDRLEKRLNDQLTGKTITGIMLGNLRGGMLTIYLNDNTKWLIYLDHPREERACDHTIMLNGICLASAEHYQERKARKEKERIENAARQGP